MRSWPLLCLSLLGCGSSDKNEGLDTESDADTDADGDSDADTDSGSDCVGTGFEGVQTDWSLPTLTGSAWEGAVPWYATAGGVNRTVDTQQTYYAWTTLDLTGDGRPDLVMTRDDADSTVGHDHWVVYEGSASGFASSATRWSLPTLSGSSWGGAVPWSAVAGGTYRSVGGEQAYYLWTTFDLSGDGIPDLVVTRDDADSSIGDDHWAVYVGSTSGFASSATDWSLPTLDGSSWQGTVPWYANAGGTYRTVGGVSTYYLWTTFDLTGDSIPDLVLTRDDADSSIGDDHWGVYAGTTSGFASSALRWSLPTIDGSSWDSAVPWNATAGGTYRTVGGERVYYHWTTFDLTGDSVPDLVMTRDDVDSSIGDDHWDAYIGSSSGFASGASAWSLPVISGSDWEGAVPWSTTASGTYRAVGGVRSYYLWTTFDLSGDSVPDLVMTRDDSDGSIGSDHWDTYEGSTSGFASGASAWSLPVISGSDWEGAVPWFATNGAANRSVGGNRTYYTWSLLDLNGDGPPDLTLTRDDSDSAVGLAHWAVFASECL